MGMIRILKNMAFATAITVIGLAAVACGGNGDNGGKGGGSEDLLPQRANLVGTVDFDRFLDAMELDPEQIFELLSSDALAGTEGLDEYLSFDPTSTDSLLDDLKRISIFGDVDTTEDSEYFGVAFYGTFDESSLIADLESLSGSNLVSVEYKGSKVYSPEDDSEEFVLSVLDSRTVVLGSGGAVNDMIDIWVGDAGGASGKLVDTLNDLGDGIFGFAVVVPEDALEGGDGDSLSQLAGLPISMDALSAIEIVGLSGDLKNDTFDLKVTIDFSNQDAAESLEGIISGFVSLAAGFSPDPRTSELLAGLEIDRDGRRLTISVGVPQSELSDIFGDLTTVTETTTQSSGRLPPGTPEIRLLEAAIGHEVPIMPSSEHVTGTTVQYSTTPPTSGMHWPEWADCGWYPDGLRDEMITHNLEHGNIVVSYNLTNPAQVTELRQVLDGVAQFNNWGVARFYDEIPDGQVALSAWGMLHTAQGVTAVPIEVFFEAYAGLLGPGRVAC